MRPASASLLTAVERTEVAEDRLTEALACVAQVNQEFASALVVMAGIEPRAGERYAVGTQRATPSGRRVDMEIAIYRGLHRTGLVWVEVKAGAIYQPNQLADYAEEVKHVVHGEPRSRVLTIIPPDSQHVVDLTPGPSRWESKTWSDVAALADRLGRGWTRTRWLDAAFQPSAPAQWRYLADFVRSLEAREYVRMKPLDAEDVVAAQRVLTLPKTLEELVRLSSRAIPGVERGKFSGPKGGAWRMFAPLEPKWFSDEERYGVAYPELHYWHEETWTPDERRAPAFFAGITFYQPSSRTRAALADQDWQSQLPAGVTVGGDARAIRLVRTKYLSELIVAGGTFDEQLQALTVWATQALSDVMDRTAPAPIF
jgi:hypothetical protein